MNKKILLASTLLILFCHLSPSEAKGQLRQNLKLASQQPKTELVETSMDYQTFRQIRDTQKQKLQQDDFEPPVPQFKDYVRPFTATPYYDFFDAFLVGLKLETFFVGSDACLMSGVYVVDDMYYFRNNISDFEWSSWEAPLMNISRAVAGNFSNVIINCEKMGENIYKYAVDRYAKFNNDIGDFLLSFLFNLMGRALQFKSIFDTIQDDLKNQYYVDIANQYGRLIRIMLDFEPTTAAALEAFKQMFFLEASGNSTNSDQEPEEGDIDSEDFKFKKAFEQEWNRRWSKFKSINQHISLPDFKESRRIFGEMGGAIQKAATFLAPTFTLDPNLYDVLIGAVYGGVNVLPTYSMISFCFTNSTIIDDQFNSIISNFQASKYDETAKSVASVLRSGNNILFNCFYTVTNPVEAAQYNRKFTPSVLLWNILFNLGYIYTNIKNTIMFFYTDTAPNTNDWEILGNYVGDLAVRFIYSRFIEKTYYKF